MHGILYPALQNLTCTRDICIKSVVIYPERFSLARNQIPVVFMTLCSKSKITAKLDFPMK